MASRTSLIQNNTWTDVFNWIKINDHKYQILQRDLINRVYPNLHSDEKTILLHGLIKAINLIHAKFGFSSNDLLWKQLIQNDFLDSRALLNLLLPFIDDTASDDKKKSLKMLKDLYLQKDAKGQFVYTNTQYNRCIRHYDGNNIVTLDRPYLKEYFEQHLELLLMSIESLSNKLYVNWTDVLPARMDRYQETSLYSDTVTKIVGRIDQDSQGNKITVRDIPLNKIYLINNYIDPNPGISYQDIYNVMANHLYHDVIQHRWLIYDIVIENRPITYLSYLEKKINLSFFWEQFSWSQLTMNEQNQFNYQWTNFLNSIDLKDNTVLRHFFFYFSKYHQNARKLIRQGKLVLDREPSDEEEDEEENVIITPEITRNTKRGLSNVPIEEIYLFFYNQLASFRKTWFYYFIKIKNKDKEPYLDVRNGVYITPKNVYNYCKSLIHYTINKKFIEIPKIWNSLKPELVQMILIRILDIPVTGVNDWTRLNWFNINNYLRRIYPGIQKNQLITTNELIHKVIRTQLVDIIFESLIYHGLLSEFRPNSTITNNQIIQAAAGPDEKNQRNERYRQMKSQYFSSNNRTSYQTQAYYYLTGGSYGDLPKYEKEYFDYLTSDQIWTFTYAMNWVSQINFYHHYLNNRVAYITGSTGVGKSTQVPKLLLYSQKMLDYNANGKIICTQPRIPPTVSNAETISRELGVPIRVPDKTYDRPIFTSNYYIQFKHQQESHIAKTDSFLRIVTDGTLYEEMKRSPFLNKSKEDPTALDNQGKQIKWSKTYHRGNKYDCVIIDEAHEHNSNMDMILTLGRDITYVNNSLKLVIVSATMEDDEAIYRRYYRKINDNRAYPLSAYIENQGLDRANMDRRIHISPPGATTQYTIRDIYLSKIESELIDSGNYLKFALKKTIEVANSSNQGDILLFVTGIADIRKAVAHINSNTAANIIALAFYGRQTEEEKAMITNIHKILPNYTRCKNDVFLDEQNVTCRVPPNTYNRAIIIATNVAEASLTLQNLRYVIDPGYAKSIIFDPLEGINKELTLPISQSSSVQRRGRVGRVAPGNVYYLYDREKIINNKTSYKIADEDVKDHIVSLLKSEPNDSFIITYENDINDITILKKIMEFRETSEYFDEELVYRLLRNPKPYLDIIQKQYLYISNLSDINQYYAYYGRSNSEEYTLESLRANFKEYIIDNHDDYQYQEQDKFLSRGHTGYDDLMLEDQSLSFYLIHPDENVIIRNLFTGKMVGIKCSDLVSYGYYYYLLKNNNVNMSNINIWQCHFSNINFENFKLLKYDLVMIEAKLQLLVVDIDLSDVNTDIHYKNVNNPLIKRYINFFFKITDRILKSIHGNNIITIKTTFLANLFDIRFTTGLMALSNLNHLLWYSYALPYDLESDVLALIILIDTIPDLKQGVGTINSRKDIDKFFNMHINNQGDIYFIWMLWNRIKEFLEKDNIYNLTKIDTTLINQFKRYKEQYLANAVIPFDQYTILDKMYYSGQLNIQDEYFYYLSYFSLNFKELIKGSTINHYLEIIANDLKLDPIKLAEFVVAYLDSLFIQNKNIWSHQYKIRHFIENEDDDVVVTKDVIEWAKQKLTLPGINRINTNPNYTPNNWDLIMEAYIRAFSTNLMKNETSHYLMISKGIKMDPIFWSKRLKKETTFLNDKTDFLIYHNTETSIEGTNAIYFTPIKIEWVLNLNPLYYYYFLMNPNNPLFSMHLDEDVKRSIKLLQANKHLFNWPALQSYLEQMDVPLRIRR